MFFILIFIVLLFAIPAAAVKVLSIDPDSLPEKDRPNLPTAKAAALLVLTPFVALVVLIIRHNLAR